MDALFILYTLEITISVLYRAITFSAMTGMKLIFPPRLKYNNITTSGSLYLTFMATDLIIFKLYPRF